MFTVVAVGVERTATQAEEKLHRQRNDDPEAVDRGQRVSR